MIKPFRTIFLGLSILIASSNAGMAIELGLTPNHVLSIWVNINNALLHIGRTDFYDEGLVTDMKNLERKSFRGKQPSDVLKRAVAFRKDLDALRGNFSLAPTPSFREGLAVRTTPSTVFLNSGFIQDSIVLLLVSMKETTFVSDFYFDHKFDGKIPDDVFSEVDIAVRRIKLILARSPSNIISG